MGSDANGVGRIQPDSNWFLSLQPLRIALLHPRLGTHLNGPSILGHQIPPSLGAPVGRGNPKFNGRLNVSQDSGYV